MSCTLHPISHIKDINRINNLLQDLNGEEQTIIDKGFESGFGYEDDRNWSDEWDSSEEWETQVAPPVKTIKSWLLSSKVSLSPSEELLVVTKETKGIFLSKKWPIESNSSEQPVYDVLWSGNLSNESDDTITCVTCVPLASQQRSSQETPDWTCIIAGFKSGYIRIFMTNGKQLLAQYLHDSSVIGIKLKTKSPFHTYGQSEQVEELMILYHDALVTIDGFSLYQSLRACRNQLAKAQANNMIGDMVDPPPLEYRKWRITAQDKVNDIASCGTANPCLFDRFQTASFMDGPYGKVKASAPAFNRLVTAGKNPFLAIYHASEGSNQPIISDVALAVASKLTSAVFSKLTAATGWFGGGSQPKQDTAPKDSKPKIETGTKLTNTVCLHDMVRQAETIAVAPLGHLAVVTDAFNRVLLLDTTKGVVIRMWKGYRDAECGWIVVNEEHDEKMLDQTKENQLIRRRALFLVIHAPKRGILEIYLSENGSRVGAFNVGRNCRLLYQGYGTLGRTTFSNGYCNDLNQCFLIDGDGSIKSIHVPFHCALSTTHSVRAKDLHLLKRLSNLIDKSATTDDKDSIGKSLVTVLLEIQVPSTQRKAVQCILRASTFSATFLQECIERIVKSLTKTSSIDENEDIEYASERADLIQYCLAQQQLIEMFIDIRKLVDLTEGSDPELEITEEKDQNLSSILHVTLSEAQALLLSLNNYKSVCLKKKKGDEGCILPIQTLLNITTFLSCFEVEVIDNHKSPESSSSSSATAKKSFITIQSNLTNELLHVLGQFLFEDAVIGKLPVSKLMLILENSRLSPKQILMLLTTYTQSVLSCNILDLFNVYHLHSLVSSICSIKGGSDVATIAQPVGKISMWWQSIRDILAESVLIGHALMMATICRSVSMELTAAAQKVRARDESDISSGDWEPVTMEMEQWNFLICQLENLLDLDCFVHSNHLLTALSGMDNPSKHMHEHTNRKQKQTSDTVMQHDQQKVSQRIPVLSVKGIQNAGFGAIAQVVADCLVRQGIPGLCLGLPLQKRTPRKRAFTLGSTEEEEDDIPEEEDTSPDTLSAVIQIREKFPYSLEQDILWVHCSWESIMVWNEDTEDIGMLSSALIHLSCIHNPVLQQGLGVMMWKAVYKESVKQLLSLIEKIGKAPKDRLCKKTVSLGYKALEEFLGTAKKLLQILLEIDIEEDNKPKFISEQLWQSDNSTQRSIAEQASEEPSCNNQLLSHYWCLVTSLHLIMVGAVKSIKPLSLFDTKGKHALNQPLHSTPILSNEIDDSVMRAREKFCCNVAVSLIKNHLALTYDDEIARSTTTELLYELDVLLELARKFKVTEDVIRRNIACELYSSGLDVAAQEMAMYIQDKDAFSTQMLEVIRNRLATSLFTGDGDKISDTISKLPTKITSWLQNLDMSKLRIPSIPLLDTYHLIQYLNTNLTSDCKEYKFINELLEGLKMFL